MLKIVKAEEKHIPDICKLWVEFMEYTVDIEPIPWFEKEHLRPAMQDPNSLILVASDGDKTVGYAYALIMEPLTVETRGKYGNIHDLFVARDCRRRGVGEQLYKAMLKWFCARDIERVELHIISRNRLASSFWRKQGFTDFEQKMFRRI
ncbi:MAG: GNAT family N-acetyltransferase [Dehalococcoidales bacterium]|jgi:ribosomal protein S18 acetylase RimI-like enzyme